MELAQGQRVPIIGLNYKDTRAEALAWLQRFGDPYTASAFDEAGRVGIDWGVYGVPETFVVDRQGIIRYKHVGPLGPEVWRETLLPIVTALDVVPE
jgi:cytochrome c biogenesis protein CcmG/thiol:disulfide interchange protein DsbE